MANKATNKITITLHADEITPQGILNAVRRATSATPEITDKPVTVKGVTFSVQPVKGVPVPSKQEVRDWLAANGHPEVVGKRGRIKAAYLAEFEAAQK